MIVNEKKLLLIFDLVVMCRVFGIKVEVFIFLIIEILRIGIIIERSFRIYV